MSIYIYSGKGTNKKCIKKLIIQLPKNSCKTITSSKISPLNWQNMASIFIIGGGRDVPYVEKLKNERIKKLKNFVENGGSYLGICAGAYFGSSYVEFDKNQKLEVLGKRELCFFSKKAIGPAFGPNTFKYKSEFGARAALVKCYPLDVSFRVYHNGGCYFEEPSDDENVEIIARYLEIKNNPPAIVKCKVKNGIAILSGVHFELDSSFLLNKNEDFQYHELYRKKLFNWIFDQLSYFSKMNK
ncbi:MAG: hypothetical protein JXA94_06955 [Parachlamydiales bacterium]|nr:hypothetical protein [Parachlamydiales bacterium]